MDREWPLRWANRRRRWAADVPWARCRHRPVGPGRRELWVLRSTLTLKATDTTLVSFDGNIGHRGALTPLPHASPETITEETPSATVTPTQSHGRGEARQSSGPSPGTGVCHCSVAILKLQACAKLCTLCLYLFGVFYNSGITQTLFLDSERSAIMPF